MFPCPEAGCIKSYQSQCALDRHLESGGHKYKPEKLSLRDAAIGAYKKELEGLRLDKNLPSINHALESIMKSIDAEKSLALPQGWAL